MYIINYLQHLISVLDAFHFSMSNGPQPSQDQDDLMNDELLAKQLQMDEDMEVGYLLTCSSSTQCSSRDTLIWIHTGCVYSYSGVLNLLLFHLSFPCLPPP